MDRKALTERRRRLVERLQTEGVELAVETAFSICRDPKAPAQARSAALNAILRAGGLFDRQDDPARKKEPHEMTPEELEAAIARLEQRASGEDEDDGIFA